MSTVIDQKIVEMKFDNRDFEKNTRETMSTLDKLKQKLNLNGAAKSIEQIGNAANKVNLSGLTYAVETVGQKFSAMEVIGVTALANITNSAVNAGKQLVKSLTVDQISSGWNKMNQKLGSVQTLVNSTGLSVEEIEEYLSKLMWFSDETSYSFTDMTSALAQMTSTGGDIKKLIPMITGIANATAFAGKGAAEFSRAIFNLNQSYGGGYLTLMDWRSLQGAGVNSKQLTQTLIDVGVQLGKIKKGEVTVGNFTETLKDKWADTKVMEEAFSRFSKLSEAAYEAVAAGKYDTASEAIEALSANFDELSVRAFKSAQEAKTFKEAIESVKDAMGSSFMKIFEDIFGNYDQQKRLWTDLANSLYDLFVEPVNKIEEKVSTALKYNPFTALLDKLKNSEIGEFAKKVNNISQSLEYYQKMVNEVWRGNWKNEPFRFDMLEGKGHNPYVIQELVNKGYKYKLTVDDVTKAEQKYGVVAKETAEAIEEISDAKLKDAGLTDEEIKMYRELEKQSKETGKSISELIDEMSKKDGRTLLIESFQNIGNAILKVFKAIGQAWNDAFPPMSALRLYNIIKAFNEFTSKLVISDKTANNLMRTLRGLFSVLGFIKDVAGVGLKIVLTLIKEVLKVFGFAADSILDVTAIIGDAIYYTRQWIKENSLLVDGIKLIAQVIKMVADATINWIKNNERIQNGISKLKDRLNEISEAIKNWTNGLKETDNIPKYILQGLANGLKTWASIAIDAMVSLGKSLIDGICKILGIHSPSTVFFEIGRNIIQGLINGVQNGLSNVVTLFKNLGLKCIEAFNKIDFGKLLAAGIGIGLIVLAKDIVDTIKMITGVADSAMAPLKGLGKALSGIGSYFTDKGKAAKTESYGKTVKNMATAIAILAGAILIISKIPKEDIWRSVGIVSGLIVAVGALYTLISILNKDKTFKDAGKNAVSMGSLVGIAAALFVAALAFKKLGSIDIGSSGVAILNLTAIVIALTTLTWAMGKFVSGKKQQNINQVAKMIAKISAALLLLVVVTKLASMLKVEDIHKGLAVIAAFELLIVGLVAVSSLAGKNADKAGRMVSRVAVAMLIMISVVKMAAKLNGSEISRGIAFITGVGLFFSALIAVSYLAGANASKAGAMMLMMSLALGIMVIVVKQIANLKPEEMKKGLKAVVLLGLVFAALVGISHFAGSNAIKAGVMLLMVSSALLMLTGVIFILSKMDTDGVEKALGIIAVLEALFGGLIFVTKYSKDCIKTVTAIIVSVTILIAALIGLSFIDSSKLAAATISISSIMGTLALLIASTKLIGDPGKLTLNLAALLGAVGILAGIVYAMSGIENPQGALTAAESLSLLLTSMAVSFGIISWIGPMAEGAWKSIGLMVLAVGLLAGMLAIMDKLNVQPSIETALSLSILLLAMSGALAILSVVGAAAGPAMLGALALDGFIVIFGALVVGLGALADKCGPLLDKGIPVLEKVGYALGSFVGNIVAGFASGVSNALPEIGQNLSNFMTNVSGFIEGAKTIDESVIKGVECLSGAIIALAGAELISAITSFLSGDFSLATFGTELSQFMANASGFISGITGVDPALAEGAKNLADAILAITGANLLESLTSWLTGESSLSGFGEQLGQLGTDLSTFVTNLGTFTEAQVTTVDCAGRAIKSLADAASTIPNEGGWADKIFGENSLATFGGYLPGFASNLASFVTNLGTFTEDQVTTVDCAGRAISTLAQAASSIPNEGGLWASIVGDNSLATFSGYLPGLGTNLGAFITNLGTFTEAQVTTIDCAGRAIKALASAAQNIPNEGGLWASIVGDNSLATFSSHLPGLGTNLASFVTNLGTFTEAQVTTVNSACNAIRSIAKLGEIDIKDTGDGLKSFGKNMVDFAKKVKDFVDKIGNVGSDGISSAITKVKELIDMASTVAGTNIDSVKTFGESLKKLAKDGVNGFVKELSSKSPKSDATKAGEELIKSFAKGIENKKDDVKDKAKAAAKAAASSLSDEASITNAETAGKNFVQGFADGISNNEYLATDAASAVGKAALDAAMEALREHSPSRETMKIGKYFSEGLAIGITQYGNKTYDSAYSVGQIAKDGLSKAISNVANMINSDMDTQPTIRPVLDLSDVRSGFGSLNSMFDTQSIGVRTNLNAISYGMNNRVQNGTNNDVVSAIDKLRKNLGNVGGDTYNINGVSYSDDNSIAEAVQVLVRAATVEGRK